MYLLPGGSKRSEEELNDEVDNHASRRRIEATCVHNDHKGNARNIIENIRVK